MRTVLSCFLPALFVVICGPATAQVAVTGRVMDVETKERLPDVRVQMMSEYGIATSLAIESRTDANGRYTLEGIPEGRWRFRATWGNEVKGGVLMTPVIEVADEPLVFDFEFLMRQDPRPLANETMFQVYSKTQDAPTVRVAGFVLDPFELRPLSDVRIQLYRPVEGKNAEVEDHVYKETLTNDKGNFLIENVEPGTYGVHVEADGYTSGFSFPREIIEGGYYSLIPLISEERARWAEMNQAESRGRIVDGEGNSASGSFSMNHVRLYGQLRGSIRSGGEIMSGALIRLTIPDYGWVNEQWVDETGQDGSFRIPNVFPGTYDILVEWNGESVTIPSIAMTNDLNELDIDL